MGGILDFVAQNGTPIAGAASAIGNVVSQWMANDANYKIMKEQNQFAHDEAALQRQAALEQWMRETSYNTPENQVRRLRDAGLNPALAMGGNVSNVAAGSPGLAEAQPASSARMVAPQVDPLTAAQIAKTNAETEAIEHNTTRADEKQPFEVEQLRSTVDQTRKTVDLMSMQEQIYSLDYLSKALSYQFQNATFNDSVRKFSEEVRSTKLGADFQEFQLRRALKLLPFEIAGYDLSNKKLQSGIALDWQEYSKVKEMLPKILREYDDRHDVSEKDKSIKEIEYWIKYADNPRAVDHGLRGFDYGDFDLWLFRCLHRIGTLTKSISPFE